MQATVRCGRLVSVDWRWTIPLTRELKVLGHPIRLAILSILNRAERSVRVCELELRLPSPTTCSGYSACWKPPVCQWPASPTTCPRPWLPGSGTSLPGRTPWKCMGTRPCPVRWPLGRTGGTEARHGPGPGSPRHGLRRGVREFYLLTETATGFFTQLGFRVVPSSEVPAPVQASAEFRGACPETAIAMFWSGGTDG